MIKNRVKNVYTTVDINNLGRSYKYQGSLKG